MATSRDDALGKASGMFGALSLRFGVVLIIAGFAITFTTIGAGRYLYATVLTLMKDALSINYGQAGALSSAVMIGYLIGSFISGVAVVRFGSRLIISLSTMAVGAAMIGQSVAFWYPLNFFLMLVIGFGAGGAFVPLAGLIAAWFPPERRGLILGIVTVGANAGIASTAVFGPTIMRAHGGSAWQATWVYFGAVAVASGILAYAGLRDRKQGSAGPGSPAGRAQLPARNWGLVFQNRSMFGLTCAYFCHGFFSIYIMFFIAFLTRGLTYDAGFALSLWSMLSFLSAVTLIPLGYLSDVFGRKATLLPCAATLAVGIIIPVIWQDPVSLAISAVLFGLSYVGPMNIITLAAGDIVGPTMAAAAIGLVTMGHGVGQMAGPGIGGVLIDLTGSFYPGFILSSLAIVAEFVIIARLTLPKVGRRKA